MLGLPSATDARSVKQAYRRLAREHHPDHGGDPATFHRLQQAYERLAADEDPGPPVVARGRPSRPPVPFVDEDLRVDLASVDWDVAVPRGDARLDRDRFAVLLVDGDRERDGDGGWTLRPLLATSRSPGSRMNGVAAKLSPEFTSVLRVRPPTPGRADAVIVVELATGNRRARRALEQVTKDGWVRERRSSTTLLRATLAASDDARVAAVRVTDRVTDLLDALSWPVTAWTRVEVRD